MQQKKSKFVTVKAYRFYLLKNVVSLDLVTLQHWFSDMKNTHAFHAHVPNETLSWANFYQFINDRW